MDECYWCGDQRSGDTRAWYCPGCAARELAEVRRGIVGELLGVIL